MLPYTKTRDIIIGRRSTPYRRRKLYWSLILFITSFCFILYIRTDYNITSSFHSRVLPWSRTRPSGQSETVDELSAILYMLTSSDDILPDSYDVQPGPLDLTVLAGGDVLSVGDWNQRIEVMDQFNPLIVFSKTYCPYSKKAKQLLETYDIHPPPRIIEVDLRGDSELIKSLLTRFTSRTTFPNTLLHGKTLGGSDELHTLHREGKLRAVLEAGGLSVGAEGDPADGVVNKLVHDPRPGRS